jgi:hypothetical protein
VLSSNCVEIHKKYEIDGEGLRARGYCDLAFALGGELHLGILSAANMYRIHSTRVDT